MDWHSRRDSLGYGTQENDTANPPGMESCLKKLGLDADWTVLGDPERDARSRWSSRRKIVLAGTQMGVYFQSPEGQKGNSG